MEITWYGLSCFRLTERKMATIVTDPFSAKLGLGTLKLKADVVTISHDAAGHNNQAAVSGQQHLLTGPGEYEIGGVFITGIATPSKDDQVYNVTYVFDFDGVTVVHLGDIGQAPSQRQIEELEQVDIMLVPVGGGNTLNAAQATELVSLIEPRIVIPMHYSQAKLGLDLEPVDRFVNEMGVSEVKEQESLKVSSAASLPEETEVVVLRSKA